MENQEEVIEENKPKRGRKPNQSETIASVDAEQLEATMMFKTYAIEVVPEFNGSTHIGFFGRLVEKLKKPGLTTNAECTQRQADILNAKCHSSRVFLYPASEPMPNHVAATKEADGSFTTKVHM